MGSPIRRRRTTNKRKIDTSKATNSEPKTESVAKVAKGDNDNNCDDDEQQLSAAQEQHSYVVPDDTTLGMITSDSDLIDDRKENDASELNTDVRPTSRTNDETDNDDCAASTPKFQFRQRVFAKDQDTGLLYEGIVRRATYGVQHQRQIKLTSTISEDELAACLEQENDPTWWYFIHYSGWNVNWDRWVQQRDLYEPTESTKLFAKRLQDEVKNIKAELRGKGSSKPAATRVAMELERRMTVMEREHRMEERRRELSAQGKVMGKAEEEDLLSTINKTRPRSVWNKAKLEKEIELRLRHLQGKRSQSSAELLVLPFALKKVLVEEWELITQSNMFATVPATVSVRQALKMYLASKLEAVWSPDEKKEGYPTNSEPKATMSKEEQEWHEMVDGICLFFDQALPERLLYQPERIQYEFLLEEMVTKRFSDVYGCEFLLRLFLRLPAILVGELSESESKSILAKLNDLVRFLQKHQTVIFAQSYRRLNDREQFRKDQLEVFDEE